LKAGRSIVEHGSNEIVDGDVVLTYGQSHHTFEILKESWVVKKTSFKVIVVDSKSTHEGLFQLKKLMKHGVPVAYTTLKGLF
jgi:translation initiation factor 2B subunit (eIF-2B alpha/beta/delta family)